MPSPSRDRWSSSRCEVPGVKALSGKAFCRLLERHGWQQLRIQGSHHVYGKTGQRARISVLVPATGRSSSGCSDTS